MKLNVEISQKTYGVTPAKTVAQEGTDEDTRERNRTEQELPLGRLLDVTVVDDARDDGTREDAVRKRDLRNNELCEKAGSWKRRTKS